MSLFPNSDLKALIKMEAIKDFNFRVDYMID